MGPRAGRTGPPDLGEVQLVVPNFKRRLSGVTTTILHLVPLLSGSIGTATLGPGLPDGFPALRWWQVAGLLRRPGDGKPRVWHARRNVEMLGGLILKSLFRAPLKLVFTSASQREHTTWTRFLIRQMDAVVATSERTAGYLEVANTVIMHGIDTARFRPAADRADAVRAVGLDPALRYVGCFGRIRRQKGTDAFVDAMIAILPRHTGWGAVVAGRTTAQHAGFEQELKARVAEAGLSDRILFVGEHKDIERWYRALSLFVAPQRWEGFGLTPLEAMASRLPVVATDVGAFSELVDDGNTGTIVPPGDVAALAEAAERFIADSPARETAGDRALVGVRERFPLEREARELLQIYRDLRETGS